MTKTKSTKRSLIMSALALFICVSMFIGSTYAWFTDTVTSSGNKIQSGTLKIDLELLNKDDGTWSSIKDSSEAIFDYQNWEPGYTDVKVLKVENEGTLALKWMAKFVSAFELTALADVIDVYVYPSETELSYPTDRNLDGYVPVGTVRDFVNTIETTTTGKLEAGDCAYLGIALKMQETAGNEYQGMDLGGTFDIMIMATQLTSEEDSFDKNYDEKATYTAEVDALKTKLAAAKAGDTVEVTLTQDAYIDNIISVPAGVTLKLNGNGNTIISDRDADANTALFFAKNSNIEIENVTITGSATYAVFTNGVSWEGGNTTASLTNVTVNMSAPSAAYPLNFGGKGNITLTNCTVTGAGRAYENNSRNNTHIFAGAEINMTVNGGNVGNVLMNANYGSNSTLTLNNGAEVGKLILATDQTKTAVLNNNGGTVKELIQQVDSEAKLKSALASAVSGQTVTVALYKDVTLTEKITVASGVNVVIYGDGKTLNVNTADYGIRHNGGSLTVSDLNITNSANGYAIYHYGGTVVLTNVTSNVDGKYAFCLYGGGAATLNNCSITGTAATMANIWFGDGRTVTINGGTYSSMLINASKGSGNVSTGSLTVNNATVDKILVGAVEDADGNVVRATLINNNSTINTVEYEK